MGRKGLGRTKSILYLGDKDAKKELYGGTLSENPTQTVARDLLANTIFNVKEHGYPVVLHVYNELVIELPEGFGPAKEMCEMMRQVPS